MILVKQVQAERRAGPASEVRRVVKPDGIVILLELVRLESPVPGWLADLMTPSSRLAVRALGETMGGLA